MNDNYEEGAEQLRLRTLILQNAAIAEEGSKQHEAERLAKAIASELEKLFLLYRNERE